MARKIRFESFVYHFLRELERIRSSKPAAEARRIDDLVARLRFSYEGGLAVVRWDDYEADAVAFEIASLPFYRRGDGRHAGGRQVAPDGRGSESETGESVVPEQMLADYFRDAVLQVLGAAGLPLTELGLPRKYTCAGRLAREEAFHDRWASDANAGSIDVVAANEACTSPEMRCIVRELGDLRGKRLLDIGCGLGEASIYFALKGATVTAVDLSQGMLDATLTLAAEYGVSVEVHKGASDTLDLPDGRSFDIIYCGNLLHHVDIGQTLDNAVAHLADDGVFVSWDPIAYNPAINVYRHIAKDVRTVDEHPLRRSDIHLFMSRFSCVSTRFFWLSTLIIFVLMVFGQRRNPNKERLWKSVVAESSRWERLYRPLSAFDSFVLRALPPLRWWCWNVVILARKPKRI